MTDIELVKSLIEEAEALEYGQNEQLDAVRQSAKMRIRKIFGKDSEYLDDLKGIRFFVNVSPSSESSRRNAFMDGRVKLINLFKTILEDLELSNQKHADGSISKKQDEVVSKQIFIVHGHDNEMKQAVARTLEKLDLEPIILHEQPDQGKTIIEKFLANADKSSFAVVVLSPDDMAYPKSASADTARPRARQNVILEMGFFIGKLGRDRVVMLYREDDDFEMPSDISGMIYKLYDGDSGNWRSELVKELKACGYAVDANKLYE